MASVIQKAGRYAIQIFKRDKQNISAKITTSQLEHLQSLVSKINIAELNIDPSLFQNHGKYNPQKDGAPVTYMQIYEDADVTVCVFILKHGVHLPLHDHPDMYGILKVLYGQVAIQSYTMNSSNTDEKYMGKRSISGIFPAIKHPLVNVTAQEPACLLSPSRENLHEISSINGPVAFLDILSPPYGSDQRLGIERECHYYEEINTSLVNSEYASQIQNGCILLLNVPSPREFWCDQAEYKGPSIGKS